MLSLKRPLFGILWFCVFAAGAMGAVGAALALQANPHAAMHDAKALNALLTAFLENHFNTLALPVFLAVLVASLKGWLPGTKPAAAAIDKSDALPRFGFSDSMALVVYMMVIQSGLEFLLGAVCETMGIPQLTRTPVARCALGGLSSILLALFALKSFRLSASGMLKNVLAHYPVFPLLLLLVAGSALIESEFDNMQRAFFQYPDFLQKAMEDMLNQGLLSVLLVAVIAPLAEEIVFRGIILRKFLHSLPAVRAVVLSAIIFSCAHMDPLQMLPAFGAGLLLGWLYLETGNLWVCIVFHSASNLVSFVVYHDYLPFHLAGFTKAAGDTMRFQPVWLDCLGVLLLAAGIAAVRAVTRRNDGEITVS